MICDSRRPAWRSKDPESSSILLLLSHFNFTMAVPFGKRHGTARETALQYPALAQEFARVSRRRVVLLTSRYQMPHFRSFLTRVWNFFASIISFFLKE